MAQFYKAEEAENMPKHIYLWAKAERTHPEQVHRLIYHLIDVGMVAKMLWKAALPSPLKEQLARWLNLSLDDTENLLAFWAALHDLGKASPAFQFKLPYMIPHLREQGFHLPDQIDKPTRHETITAWAIQFEKLLVNETELDAQWAQRVAQALGGHHGAWHPYNEIADVPDSERGGEEWTAARCALVRELKTIFQPPVCHPDLLPIEQNALLTIFSGFVSVADWIGSDENLFRYTNSFTPAVDYAHMAEVQAYDGLKSKGWLTTFTLPKQFNFPHLFGVNTPTTIQQKIIELAGTAPSPALAIIESPTGSGKTEAALSLYALWTQSVERPGLYVAMPTTATSDQMHERVAKFLALRYQIEIRPLLVHSRALLREDQIHVNGAEKVEEELAQHQTWFLPRKRSLLAPFGVGTVDQTFYSVLQTKHFFVRLLGLSHKVVIFDEVHAYDAYMAMIFCRLLRWLRAVNASVILLSATLPEAARRRFVEAYTDQEDETPSVEYPRLTLATSRGVQTFPLPKPNGRTPLELKFVSRNIDKIIAQVHTELQHEGCIAVICNTVRRAQEVYLALEAANKAEQFCPADKLILFHARTIQQWRDETQQIVLKALSKEARQKDERPTRMVVVATQVIEQSLDLDFDVMISDLAPLDLLVQRAGRLHRHKPHQRNHAYRLLITAPETKNGIPYFPRTEFPYEPHFLFRTWVVLQSQNALTLDDDAPRLIEKIYGDEELTYLSPALSEVMIKAKQICEKDQASAERQAGQILVSKPSVATLLAQSNQELPEDDDPQIDHTIRALTRRDSPGISLVCLHRINNQLFLDAEGNTSVNVNDPTNIEVRELTRHIITVSSYSVVEHFKIENADNYPPRWKRIAALRNARLAVFENDEYIDSSKFNLRLTRVLGLQIDYRKSGGQDDDL